MLFFLSLFYTLCCLELLTSLHIFWIPGCDSLLLRVKTSTIFSQTMLLPQENWRCLIKLIMLFKNAAETLHLLFKHPPESGSSKYSVPTQGLVWGFHFSMYLKPIPKIHRHNKSFRKYTLICFKYSSKKKKRQSLSLQLFICGLSFKLWVL